MLCLTVLCNMMCFSAGICWIRFGDRSCRALPARRPGDHFLVELTLAHQKQGGAEAFIHDVTAREGSFQLRFYLDIPFSST